MRKQVPFALGLSILLAATATPAFAGTIRVDATVDSPDANPGDGTCLAKAGGCTLRAAIQEASAADDASTIQLPGGNYPLHAPDEGEYAAGGVLFLAGEITVSGEDSDLVVIDGGGKARILEISKGATVSISGVTLRNAFGEGETGAAITNRGTLTLDGAVLRDNRAKTDPLVPAGRGAALLNLGTATVRDATFEGNRSDGRGGAVYTAEGAALDVLGTSFTANTSLTDSGGALASAGTTRLTLVSFVKNKAENGGAIDVVGGTLSLKDVSCVDNTSDVGGGAIRSAGELLAVNVTLSGNVAGVSGGGIWTTGTGHSTLNNVTIANNRAGTADGRKGSGGGIASDPGATTTIGNSIIAANASGTGKGPDCAGRLDSRGYDLLQDPAGCALVGDKTGNVIGQEARLAALDAASSPTAVVPLDAGSPAIDAGNPARPTGDDGSCAPVDQRGVTRPQAAAGPEARCDIGAFEVKPAS